MILYEFKPNNLPKGKNFIAGSTYIKYDPITDTSSKLVSLFKEFCKSDKCELTNTRQHLDYMLNNSKMDLVSKEEINDN